MNSLQPPTDAVFQAKLVDAISGRLSVYGAIIDPTRTRFSRFDENFRPERTVEGEKALQLFAKAWQEGNPAYPWLYASNDKYIVTDDYIWLAAMEKWKPTSVPVNIVGEPLTGGLISKTEALPVSKIKQMLGIVG